MAGATARPRRTSNRKSKDIEAGQGTRYSGPLGRVRAHLKLLGPGLVTGASDDDPSGIGTYAQTGGTVDKKE